MTVLDPETLYQVGDFKDPTVLDIFEFEDIFDRNNFPYLAFSPTAYRPEGPQMALSLFPTDDVTKRRENGGIVNITERRNAQEHFGDAMDILRSLRSAYIFNEGIQLPLTNSDALRIGHMGVELPRYLLWQQNAQFLNGELPPATILLSRALRGFHGLVSTLSWGDSPSQEYRRDYLQQPFSAEDLTSVVVEKKALESTLVCAGHWNMIEKMLEIIEGEVRPQIVEARVAFHPRSLMDFAKSLRTIWDVTFPGTEHSAKVARDGELTGDDQDQLSAMMQMTNMANLLIRQVIGYDQEKPLDMEDVIDSFDRYTSLRKQQDNELVTAVQAHNAESLTTD